MTRGAQLENATLGSHLDPRRNSLNVIRLVLAASVIMWHSFFVGGFDRPSELFAFGGQLGVDCFFAISGYLITQSWVRNPSAGRFLWHRALRLLPGYWVCLVVTTVVAGVAFLASGRGGLGGYVAASHGPLQYISHNAFLVVTVHDIGGTPTGVPLPGEWNIPLWTLMFEALCYLGVLGAGMAGLLRGGRPQFILPATFGAVWLGYLAQHGFGVGGQEYGRFALMFSAGAALWALRDRLRATTAWAIGTAAVVAAALFLLSDYRIIAAMPVAYLLIWIGGTFSGPDLLRRHDISYGVYIYGYVVQQALAMVGLPGAGYAAFTVTALAVTVLVASASWLLVERRASSLKDYRRGRA